MEREIVRDNCYCGPQYYKPDAVANCTRCSGIEGIDCNQIGTGSMPPVAPNYWRFGNARIQPVIYIDAPTITHV